MHDHAGRSAAVVTVPSAGDRESSSWSAALGDGRKLRLVQDGDGTRRRSPAGSCAERAAVLLAELRGALVSAADHYGPGVVAAPPTPWGKIPGGAALTPAGEIIPARTATWLRHKTGAPVLTPGYETELTRRTGPDLFGLLQLPPPPPFLAKTRTETLRPHHIAPLLRRISMTQPPPTPADLTPAALATDPGPVSTYHRTPAQRRWEQPPGTPQLPPTTTIPHIIHGIWLGGPIPPAAAIRTTFAAAADTHPHHDFALWTDIDRAAFHTADTTPPAPPGTPDPHAPLRDMLTWARTHHIHLINIHEIFHNNRPMTLHPQYTAETNKQLPRGYAGASDHLRLDIIHLLGGTYIDGDNHITTPNRTGTPALTTLTDAVAASPHAFTLHMLPAGINNDLIIAPARHPAITLWRELDRGSYLFTQREIFGGVDKMARRYIGRPANQLFLRYTVPMRAARLQGLLFKSLAISLDDERMVRAAPAITHGSELSWSRPGPPPPPAPLTPAQITATLTRAVTTLARQLTTREGNLHLTAIAPLITTLPDPDAAWTAIITLLAELTNAGTIPPATSITQFRYNDDGTPSHITLPPEAEAHITRTSTPQPAWLLDEAVIPAGLTTRSQSTVADAVVELAGAGTAVGRRVRRGRRERAERAAALLSQLRGELTAADLANTTHPAATPPPWGKIPGGAALTPAGEIIPARTATWLRHKTGAPVLTPGYETELTRRTGPDLFGLLQLPPPPPFLAKTRTETLRPHHIAPLLRRISMTQPPPTPADLTPAALATDPGPVSTYHRTPAQRRWEQPPGTPQLPPTTTIPHIIHGIWLGGPIPPAAAIRTTFAAAADTHPHHDFALWTDIDRAAFHTADTTPPAPPGTPDPHAPLRDMLTWARTHHIHLINIHEIFHNNRPMTLHPQYTAETNKQLPRGYAGASDHLRLDIIHLLGGTYIDGDNHITTPNRTGTPALTTLTDAVAASPHGFALHLLPGRIVNNDLIVAPARHPAITLWRELNRASYLLTQPQLFGGVDEMAKRYVERPATMRWKRYTVAVRAGRVHCRLVEVLGIAIDDERMVRAAPAITHGSELSWSRPGPPPPPAPLTPAQITATLTRAVTTLARQLTTREGNLHLTAIAPLITTLPDPDAAWTAIITLLAELTNAGTIPPATSITQFRYNDDGTPSHITLPPEAEAHITRTPTPQPAWLGHATAAPGHPAWLLDETITPARLTTRPHPTNLPPLRILAQPLTDPHGTTTGLRIPAPNPAPASTPATSTPPPPAPAPPAPPGYTTIELDTRYGHAWTGHHPITPEDLAILLTEHGLHTKPLLLTTTHHSPHTPTTLATRLTELLHQPTLTTEHSTDTAQAIRGQVRDQVDEARVQAAESTMAEAIADAENLAGLQAIGREAVQRTKDAAAGPGRLMLALDTRSLAAMLADADLMTATVPARRDAARQAASDQVLKAHRLLSDERGGRLPSWSAAVEAATAAGAAAGILATDGLLRNHDRARAVKRWRASLTADPGTSREISAVRRRLARGSSGSGNAIADQVQDELRSGKWPTLRARLQLIEQAERQAHAAIGVRAIAEAVRERRTTHSQARPQPALEPQVAEPQASGPPGSEPSRAAAAIQRRVRRGRRERAERAAALLSQLRGELTAADLANTTHPAATPPPWGKIPGGAALTPAGEIIPARTATWLRHKTGAPVLTPGYETELTRRTGPDLFGLLQLPPPPPFLAKTRTETLRPHHIAPLLRRISMTQPPPTPADLTPAALATDPGPVSTYHRTPAQRRWEQPPGTPQLPPTTTIPHIIHGIWLGGPIPPAAAIRTTFAAAADTHPHHDFALWTDIDRAAFHTADTTPPAPPGTPDPHAPLRDMLTWARTHHIHLINIHEIFHNNRPMTLHPQYTAETNKQLPRGYAGASDHLRLDIIHLLGGTYIDGDNHITTPNRTGTPALTTLTDAVAASPHAFTLHMLPAGINNDLIIAPARHPAITLWRELGRHKYLSNQRELFGGIDRMTHRYVGHPKTLLRYSVVHRTGRIHHDMLTAVGIAIDDERMVRAAPAITHGSELSWSRPGPPPPPAPLTPAQITATLTRAVTTLARQLTTREGNLHLTAIAPLITTLPDPDAAWTAIITLLAELTNAGTIPPATSITQFRYNDDGTPSHITLPPEAEAHITRTPTPQPAWLGHATAAPGHPAWLLDETITPARLTTRPHPTNLPPLRILAQPLTDPHGTTTGLRIPAPNPAPASTPATSTPPPPAPAPPAPPGYTTIELDTRYGHAWTGHHPITPEDLAILLTEHGLHTKPLLLTTTHHSPHTPTTLATRLTELLHQPTLTTEQ